MVKDAEAHAAEDKKTRDAIEARNNAESVVYAAEKALKEHGDKVSADERGRIEAAVNELKETLKDSNADPQRIKEQTEKVQQASMELGQRIYQQSQQQGGQNGGSGSQPGPDAGASSGSSGSDGPVDASYEEI